MEWLRRLMAIFARTRDAVAITAYRAGSKVRRLTYREYAGYVERFAAALYELGVRPGWRRPSA